MSDIELNGSLDAMNAGGSMDMDVLRTATSSTTPRIRYRAITLIGVRRAMEARDLVLPFLRDENAAFRFAAVRALLCVGGQEEADLVRELEQDADPQVRTAAESYRDRDASRLVTAYPQADLGLKIGMVRLLGCLGGEAAERHLIACLEAPFDEVREAAADSLKLVPGSVAAEALVRHVAAETYHYVKQAMAGSLVSMFPVSPEAVLEGLRNGAAAPVLWESARTQGRSADVVRALLAAAEKAPERWPSLSQILGAAKAEEIKTPVMDTARRSDRSSSLQAGLLEFLAMAKVSEARDLFLLRASDAAPKVRGNALWGLGALGRREDVPLLEKGWKDSDPYVRWCALWSLGEILGAGAAPWAEKGLKDTDPNVRQTAQEILDKASKEAAMNDPFFRLNHDTILIRNAGKHIYIDPFQLPEGFPKADIILITHDHHDHLSPEDVRKIATEKTELILPEAFSAKAAGLPGKATTIASGGSASVGGIEVQAVPAYNPNKKFHPKAYGGVGYFVKAGGITYYHAGDTDLIPEMKEFPPADICFLPVSGTYVMTAKEAAEATKVLKCKKAVPMHYGAIIGGDQDAEEFKKLAACPVEILPKTEKLP